ncbi:hypothetical protein MNBD_CHLOROFLEXI01-5290 [hydrothermal vent metagenome]|uniref:Uncharacterized protein n=1 Tax=hydrothermal vent metagenome TaxID=652676 RepID=A0A3B0VW30_9ZZZZ
MTRVHLTLNQNNIVFQPNADNLANADNLVLDAIPRLYLFDMELNQIQLIGILIFPIL